MRYMVSASVIPRYWGSFLKRMPTPTFPFLIRSLYGPSAMLMITAAMMAVAARVHPLLILVENVAFDQYPE